MQLLIIILNNPERLNDVVSGLLEAGVPGGTLIESQGMGQIVSADIPIFAGFRQLMAGAKPFNHTLLSVIPDQSVATEALNIVNDILGEGDSHQGIIFTLPVEYFAHLGLVAPAADPDDKGGEAGA